MDTERHVAVREAALRDLVDLARVAADVLRGAGIDGRLPDALDGSAAEASRVLPVSSLVPV